MTAVLSFSLKHKTCNSGLFLIVDKSWQTDESTITRGDCIMCYRFVQTQANSETFALPTDPRFYNYIYAGIFQTTFSNIEKSGDRRFEYWPFNENPISLALF